MSDAIIGLGLATHIAKIGGSIVRYGHETKNRATVAAYLKSIKLPAGQMLTSEMIITTAVGYPIEFPFVIEAMPRLKDTIASLISHGLPFDQVIEGLTIAADPQSAKVMIEFDA